MTALHGNSDSFGGLCFGLATADGLAQKDIVKELDGKLKTKTSDQKRLIYNTLFNLRKRGTVEDVAGLIRIKLDA